MEKLLSGWLELLCRVYRLYRLQRLQASSVEGQKGIVSEQSLKKGA